MKTLIPLLFETDDAGLITATSPGADWFMVGTSFEEVIRKAQIYALRAMAAELEQGLAPVQSAALNAAHKASTPEASAFAEKVKALREKYFELTFDAKSETKTGAIKRVGETTGSTKGIRTDEARAKWIERVEFLIEKTFKPAPSAAPNGATGAYNADP